MGLKTKFNSLSKRRKIAAITGCALFILFILCSCCFSTILIASSMNLGKRNALSTLSQVIPTENIPVLQQFGKSHEQIVQDAFVLRNDEDYAKNYSKTDDFKGTFIANSKVETSFALKTDSGDVNGDFEITGKTNYNFQDKIIQQNAKFSGTFSYGVVNVDLKNNPIEIETISQEGNPDSYMKISMTDKLIDMIFSQSGTSYSDIEKETGINIKDYLNTYLKVNPEELQKEYEKMYGSSSSSNRQYSKEEIKKFTDELIKNYNEKISSKFSDFATVEYKGREDVNGLSSIRYQITIDKDKFQTALISFMDTVPQTMIDNKDLFSTPEDCKLSTKYKTSQPTPGFCNEEQIGAFRKSYLDAKPEMKSSLTKFFNSIDINDFFVNIIPATNSIVKFEISISVNDYGKKEINKSMNSKNSLEKLTFKISADYQVKDNADKIEIPQNAKDLVQLLRDINDYQKKRYTPVYDYDYNYYNTDYYNI